MANGTLKVQNIETSSGSGTITLGQSGETIALGSGVTSKMNHPAFEAYLSPASQVPSDNVITKIQFDEEDFDTNNCYDNTTNYRFTPTVAGKYFVYARGRGQTSANSDLEDFVLYIYKNGAVYGRKGILLTANYIRFASHTITQIIDMNGTTDYIEIYGKINSNSGGSLDGFVGGSQRYTIFGAYRLGVE